MPNIQPGESKFERGLKGGRPGDRASLDWVGRIEISVQVHFFTKSIFRAGFIVRIGGGDMYGAGFEQRCEFGSGMLRFEHWDAYRGGERKSESAVFRGRDNEPCRGGGDRKAESGAFSFGECSMGSRARTG